MIAGGRSFLNGVVKIPGERSIRDRVLGIHPEGQEEEDEVIEERRQLKGLLKRNEASNENDTILLGHDRRKREVRRSLSSLKSIIILGLPGQGKSSTASWIVAQMIERGAKIAIIDRHARSDESLSAMLSPFEAAQLMSPAYTPEMAIDTLQLAEEILQSRMEKTEPSTIPFILVIDEMTDILKKLNQKSSAWGDVARAMADVVEGFNAMGRKYNCFALCIGQLTNASRTGGTEVRELFSTRLIHGMQESQARLVLPKEIAHMAANLRQGEIIVDCEGKEEPFQIKVPQLSRDEIRRIAKSIVPFSQAQEKQEDGEEEMEVIPIGRDNKTKQEIGIPKQSFDLLVRLRAAGSQQISGYRGIQEFLDCTETHARTLNKLVDEACEAGRESARLGE